MPPGGPSLSIRGRPGCARREPSRARTSPNLWHLDARCRQGWQRGVRGTQRGAGRGRRATLRRARRGATRSPKAVAQRCRAASRCAAVALQPGEPGEPGWARRAALGGRRRDAPRPPRRQPFPATPQGPPGRRTATGDCSAAAWCRTDGVNVKVQTPGASRCLAGQRAAAAAACRTGRTPGPAAGRASPGRNDGSLRHCCHCAASCRRRGHAVHAESLLDLALHTAWLGVQTFDAAKCA